MRCDGNITVPGEASLTDPLLFILITHNRDSKPCEKLKMCQNAYNTLSTDKRMKLDTVNGLSSGPNVLLV